MKDIKELANDCFGCPNKPCSQGCPMRTNIPEFIKEIKNDNIKEAYNILHSNNIFSHICSIVCPQEKQCEGSCIRKEKLGSTHIGELERYVNEEALKNNYHLDISKKEKNGKRVAVVGSGPAGLECAYELLREGYDVDIYEKENEIGGLLTYGIPDFRLEKDIVQEVINILKELDVKFYLNKKLGKDIFIKDLSVNYDYVFIGIGASKSTIYNLGLSTAQNVFDSDEFLKKYHRSEKLKLGKTVVIGGGNVAMDSARAAIRMGATEVKILYRRDRIHMPAREIELEDALKEGIIFKELVRVESANEENGKIVSVNCVETEIVNNKAVDKENGKKYTEEANTIVFAIGSKPDRSTLEEQGLEMDEWGYLNISEKGRTNLPNVFAAGDVCDSNAYVCRALASAKRAANSIINS